jgi:hypothetical protein
MPVRDSSAWRHGIVQKKVHNMDSGEGRAIVCAWDTCERVGYEMYKIINHLGNERGERTMNYVFCSERHKQYWIAAIRPGNNNNLPPGMRNSM